MESVLSLCRPVCREMHYVKLWWVTGISLEKRKNKTSLMLEHSISMFPKWCFIFFWLWFECFVFRYIDTDWRSKKNQNKAFQFPCKNVLISQKWIEIFPPCLPTYHLSSKHLNFKVFFSYIRWSKRVETELLVLSALPQPCFSCLPFCIEYFVLHKYTWNKYRIVKLIILHLNTECTEREWWECVALSAQCPAVMRNSSSLLLFLLQSRFSAPPASHGEFFEYLRDVAVSPLGQGVTQNGVKLPQHLPGSSLSQGK